MESQQDLVQLLSNYQNHYPAEAQSLEMINQFVHTFKGDQLYSRSNFIGHITASAFIFNIASQSLLFIKHTALNRWLQPGGHIEKSDRNLLAACLREAEEETGIIADKLNPIIELLDVDSHPIPENNNKNEPAHFHHDMRYMFLYNEPIKTFMVQKDVSGCEWLDIKLLEKDYKWASVISKIRQITT